MSHGHLKGRILIYLGLIAILHTDPNLIKKSRRNSSGVILCAKTILSSGISILKDDVPDMIWLKLDKTFFGVPDDVLLCLCYITPSNSTYQIVNKHNLFDQIALDIAKFEYDFDSPLFIVAGDLNGRTGSGVADYIECDSASYLPLYDNYVEDIPSSHIAQCAGDDDMSTLNYNKKSHLIPPRVSMDKILNEQDKCILELCKIAYDEWSCIS